MSWQYSPNGLVVLIVDAAGVETGAQPQQDDLRNFTYDWQLDSIPVLVDPQSAAARAFGVNSTPVTFLIGADGKIQQRWGGFASASQLALSIEPLVGAPAFRNTDSVQSIPITSSCPNEAPVQAQFAGVGLARPFSEQLWVVDGGTSWGTGAGFPLQFILIDTQNTARQQAVRLQVFVHSSDTAQETLLLEQPMELLPPEVASGLLAGVESPPVIYSLVTTANITQPGCLEVRAVVTHDGEKSPLYQGNLIVPAQ
jgi:hypothetical protein